MLKYKVNEETITHIFLYLNNVAPYIEVWTTVGKFWIKNRLRLLAYYCPTTTKPVGYTDTPYIVTLYDSDNSEFDSSIEKQIFKRDKLILTLKLEHLKGIFEVLNILIDNLIWY